MIFYKSKSDDGRMVIAGTQAEARAVNKQFDQIDIPTDKAGLMAFVQRFVDEEFELNKLLDEQSAELVRLTAGDDNISCPGELSPPPTVAVEIKADQEFIADVRRQISVEEEIQNCDPPRLATLAQNVAWRFHELSKRAGGPDVNPEGRSSRPDARGDPISPGVTPH